MTNYNLPKLPSNQRWYLSRTSDKYADLKLQERRWLGLFWTTRTYETLNTSGRYHPFEHCVSVAAKECIRTINAPKPRYGVLT